MKTPYNPKKNIMFIKNKNNEMKSRTRLFPKTQVENTTPTLTKAGSLQVVWLQEKMSVSRSKSGEPHPA